MKTFKYYLSLLLMLMVALPSVANRTDGDKKPDSFVCTNVTPAEGEVESLKEFVLTFEDASNPMAQVGGFKPNAKVRLYDDGDMSVAVGTLEKISGIKNRNKAKVVLDKEITSAGSYYLSIAKGLVFDAHFDDSEPDLGVSLGAVYNPAIRFDYTIKGTTSFDVDPDPAVELKSIPEKVNITVSTEVGNVDMALLTMGNLNQTSVETTVDGNVISVSLPVEKMANFANFSLMIYANDANGNPLAYNDPEMIYLEYNVAVSPNTFLCQEITPAEGEVKSLKDFALVFKNNDDIWGDFIGGFDASKKVILRDEEGTAVATGQISADLDKMVSIANISLNTEVTLPGVYTLCVKEGSVYNSSFNEAEKDFGVEKFGAIYNPELSFTYTIAGESISFNPNPADGKLQSVPEKITMTFAKEIKSAEEVMVNMGMGNMLMLDASQVVINGNEVTLNLPVDKMQNIGSFSLLLVVTDVDGNTLTYGDWEEGYVYVEYQVVIPSNTFLCQEVTPAEGEVKSLKDFALVFKNSADPWGDFIGGFDSSKKVILRDEDGTAVATGSFSADLDKMVSVANVSLNTEIDLPGVYTLCIKEGSVYNSSYNQDEKDFGVEKFGAVYNPEINFVYTIAGESIVFDPDPANGKLETVPAEITMTFAKEIKSVEQVMVNLGMGNMLMLDASQVIVDGKKVTLKLPVDEMKNISGFSLLLVVTDVDGNTLTYGDWEEGYVYVEYEVIVPANTYMCREITPAEGEVSQLKDFALTFVNYASVWGDNIGGVDSTKTVELLDEYGTVTARGQISVDYDNFSSIANISLDRTIVGKGTYTLLIPEGTIYNSGYNASDEDKGVANFGAVYNPELSYVYNVVPKSSIKVNPDPSELLAEVPAEIVVTFENEIKKVTDAAINMGSGYSIPLEDSQVVINGKQVTLKMPVDKMAGFPGFVVVFAAEDVDGKLVTYGNELDYVTLEYNVQLPANTFMCDSISPAEGEVTELEHFVLTFSGSDMVGGFDESKQIVVMNQLGQEVAKGTPSFSSNWDNILDVEISLDKKITEEGTYFLVIPEGTVYDGKFNGMEDDLGVSGFGATYNPELRYMYVVSGSKVVGNTYGLLSVNPAEGEVAELNKFEITLLNEKDKNDFIGALDDSKEVLLKNEAGEVVSKATVSFDPDAWNSVFTVVLEKSVKEEGKYSLVIPEGLVYNSACDPNASDFGVSWGAIYNPEIVLNYTVGASTGLESIYSGDAEVEVYNLKGVLVAKSLKNLPKGIYVVNGKKFIVK